MDVHKPKDTARNIYIYILMTRAKQKSSMHQVHINKSRKR